MKSEKVLEMLGGANFTQPQSEKGSHVYNILQSFKQRDKMQEVVIRRVANPTFNGNPII